jgi:hypothetical protein
VRVSGTVTLAAVSEWVGEIVFSPEVDRKIRQRASGGVTPDQVRQAVACGAHDRADWHEDARYGRRLILTGSDDHGELVAYLRPLDQTDGRWECLTAWRI